MTLVTAYWDQLLERQAADGGFSDDPAGDDFRSDATAWAALALAASSEHSEAAAKAADRLAGAQLDDGRVLSEPDHLDSVWTTPLALLAWTATDSSAGSQSTAAEFLLGTQGVHWEREDDSPVTHDTAIPGWSWVLGTHSWVEPTSLAILALRAAGHPRHERVTQGMALLTDRRLSGGGWNYGNTVVLGTETRPLAESTGVALSALSGRTESEWAELSLSYLNEAILNIRTPLSLGWGLMGLAAWQKRPADADARIEETLRRQDRLGPYPTRLLALTLLASVATRGLLAAIQREAIDG